MRYPLVSVVMPVYNSEKYLKESIGSILNQTFKEFEFIIINDGSNDNSLEIIKSFKDSRIIVINQTNGGISNALNNGIRIARGKYIARMDADDFSLKERLAKQLCFFLENPGYVLIGSNATFIDVNGEILYNSNLVLTDMEIRNLLPSNPFFHSSTMFLRDAFYETGGYNELIRHHFEDRILWSQMSKFGKLYNLSENLIYYRLVPESVSNKSKDVLKQIDILCDLILQGEVLQEYHQGVLFKLSKTQSISEKLANYHLRIGKIYLEHNFVRSKAFNHLFKSLIYQFFNKITLFNFLLCFVPYSIIKKWKYSRQAKHLKKIR